MCERKTFLPLLLFVVSMACVGQAGAVPITFAFTGIGAGSLYRADLDQTISFQNTLIGATFATDTAHLQNPSPNLLRYDEGAVTGSFAVAGFSVGEFANTPYIFQNSQQAVPLIGFGDSADFDIFGVWFSSSTDYDMQSAFSTTAGYIYFPGTTTIALANGNHVVLTEMHGSPNVHPSFTATIGETVPVPESASVLLLLAGFAGAGLFRSRKGQVANSASVQRWLPQSN